VEGFTALNKETDEKTGILGASMPVLKRFAFVAKEGGYHFKP